MMKRLATLLTLMILALVVVPDAHAKGNRQADPFSAEDDFANSEEVTDKELSKNRGGFININGMLIDFGFSGSASINGNIVSQIQLSMADIIAAAQNNPNNFIQPQIIQNVDNDVLIAVQQALNLQISGAETTINNAAQFNNAAYQSVFLFH